MIHITLDPDDTRLVEMLVSNLQQVGYSAISLPDGMTLNDWLARKKARNPASGQSAIDSGPITVTLCKTTLKSTPYHPKSRWSLNPLRLDLTAPDGRTILLSHNECCILRAAANANGHLVSRKTLIKALDQDYLHYDERRLEALISRLRRKLAPYVSEGFPVQGVKGQGYVFGVKVQEVVV